ncbi:tyrosine-type recombinase/integrase [Castellaniella sp.]|uniref:tyrosine-type recombinase/integrase n=1 Tax=Castellaniella sp. TaxID=1955812 RepID=UPI00356A9265
MSRSFAYALRPVVINAAKPKDKPYALTDGGGLYLEILPTGTKVWRYKFHFEGRRDKITIGRYPAVSLKDARQVHAELMDKVLKGENPKAGRQSRAGGQSATPEQLTFEAYARQWVEETLFYRSAAYRAQQLRWLESHVFPAIGGRPLAAVAPREVLDVLEPLRTTAVTAEGVRSLIQRIYNYAIRNLVADSNPALMVRGAISVPKRTHHKHLLETEVGRLWRQIPRQGAHFTTLVAVQMLFYTMVRKGELIRSRWIEFDLTAGIWDIPAERMKMRKRHRVYLPRQAVVLLQALQPMTGHQDYVFPTIYASSGRVAPMGEATLNHFFKRIDFGVQGFAPHGVRGTAATLLREHGIRSEVVELLLSHAPRGQVEAAYNHAELGQERREALQFLADHLDRLAQQSD